MAKNIKKKVYNYTAIFEPAEEGGYVVYVPALPGCASQGDTFEEAEVMAKDAIEGYLKALKDLNEEIPVEPDRVIISKIPASL
ncbi:MAG: type II toxin-antitoxin system HicB family antitoxin [Patescibacteria group bacterium]